MYCVQRTHECIIDLATKHLDVNWDHLQGRSRDRDTVRARHLLCYTLYRTGYSMAHIGRLLDRNHSTIVHAIHHVEQDANLAMEGQRLTDMVLPYVRRSESKPGDVTRAISQALLQALAGAATNEEVYAVCAYVSGTLLGRKRVSSCHAAWGLFVLTARPDLRLRVEDVLQISGLGAYCGLIDLQCTKVGLR
jgi:hypothetical protein